MSSMWGKLSDFVGNDALENIKGLARDLGNLDAEEDEYEDQQDRQQVEIAAQTIQLKDYKEEVMKLRQSLRKAKLDHAEQLRQRERELNTCKEAIAMLRKRDKDESKSTGKTSSPVTSPRTGEGKVSYEEFMELQKKSQQMKHALESRLARYRKVTVECKKLIAQEQASKKKLETKLATATKTQERVQNDLKAHRNQLKISNAKILQLIEACRGMKQKNDVLVSKRSELEGKLSLAENSIARLKEDLKAKNEPGTDIKGVPDPVSPSSGIRTAIEGESEIQRQRADSLHKRMENMTNEFDRLRKENTELEEKVKKTELMCKVQKQRISTLTADRDELSREIKEARLELKRNARKEEGPNDREDEVKTLQKDLSDLQIAHKKLETRYNDHREASELNAASRHALASSLQDISDVVRSFCKHYNLRIPESNSVSQEVPEDDGIAAVDEDEHIVFGKSESKIALESVRFLVQQAAQWIRDSRENKGALDKLRSEAAYEKQVWEEKLAKLQTECDEAFEREEEARKKAAQAEASYHKLEQEHSEAVEALETRENEIEEEDQRQKQSLQNENRSLHRELSKMKQSLLAAEQDSELKLRQLEERDSELKDAYEDLKAANERVSTLEKEQNSAEDNIIISESFREEVTQMQKELQVSRDRVKVLEEEAKVMSSLATDFSKLKRENDSLKIQCEQKGNAVVALQQAMENMEKDMETTLIDTKNKIEQAESSMRAADMSRTRAKSLEADLERQNVQTQKLERELTGVQRYVLRLEKENGALRKGYEKVMQKMRELSEDGQMIDRRLMVKLVVTYFEQGYDRDVLDLMARMLQFTEEEKTKVGLSGGNVLGRTLSWMFSGSEVKDESKSDDKNIADLWVDFLMQETELSEKKRLEASEKKGQVQESTSR